MQKQIVWIFILIGLFIILGGLSFALNMYFDYLWFQELGKTVIFTTSLYAKSLLGSIVLLIAFLFIYLNLWFANRAPGEIQIGIPTPTGQLTAYTFSRETVRRIAGLFSAAVALFYSLQAAANWEVVWRWLHKVSFASLGLAYSQDPIFQRDISFYFFSLPVWEYATQLCLTLSLFTLAMVAALYYFKGVLSLKKARNFNRRNGVGIHISLLGAVVFLALSADAYLDRFQIMFSQQTVFSGPGYADLHARLPMLVVLFWVSLLGTLLLIYNSFARNNRPAVAAVILYGGFMILGNVYPAIVQKFIVAPNEFDKESPQISHNITATLNAYGLSKVEDLNLSGDKTLTPADIKNNAATIQSIRLWDHEPLLDALKQIQEIRTYYDFASVDNDRYSVNGNLQQTMLSARELNSSSLPERNWINEHLSYTHGYGITLGGVNQVTNEGLPILYVKDIPPSSTSPVFAITRPEIYYGELTRGYAIVQSGQKEFDYPSGEENKYTTYTGSGGVPVASFLRKLLFAVYFKDPNIVLSPLLKSDSRFLYFRDLRTRVSKMAPFLSLDQDPYLVISEGKLYWIQDGYTISTRYPYSTSSRDFNYIRNSAKIVLDAYNGKADIYIADPEDPIIRTYQGIFPGVLKPLSEIPPDLRKHLRYPEDLFKIQTQVYSVYHMEKPQIFYNKEDLWEIPELSSGASTVQMSPYYTIMRLPQGKEEEFILMLPFTPGRKDNLSAWMVARSDSDNYGKLVVYRFPKQKLVYGPKQIVARINQDAEISRQVSLWDQRGSQVIQGTLLVIPVEEALLYVRPLYLRAESGKIPELKRVIVAYENKIAMEETLDGALARIFETEPSSVDTSLITPTVATRTAESTPGTNASGLIRQARESYDRAVQAQRQGDWAKYGEELKRLGAILEDLNKNGRNGSKSSETK
jgi:uncharacterized protein